MRCKEARKNVRSEGWVGKREDEGKGERRSRQKKKFEKRSSQNVSGKVLRRGSQE